MALESSCPILELLPSLSTEGIPLPALETRFQDHSPSQLSASARSAEFRKAEAAGLRVCSFLCPPQDSLGGGGVAGVGGEDRPGHSRWPMAVCFWCQCILLPSFPTVLQHAGEQHRQSVCPPDHSQVSVGSAWAWALCRCPRVFSFQPRMFHT